MNDPEPVALWPFVNRLFEALRIPPVTRRVSVGTARTIGAVAETVWRLFRLGGEPPMTRFVASQLGATHTYDIGPAVRAFGYTPEVAHSDAFARTVAWLERPDR